MATEITPSKLGQVSHAAIDGQGSGYSAGDLLQILGGDEQHRTEAIVVGGSGELALHVASNTGYMYEDTDAAASVAITGLGSGATFDITALHDIESDYAPSTSWGLTASIGILEPSYTGVTAPEEIEFPDDVAISDLSGTEITISDLP